MKKFERKVVLVTGASSGIGEEIAQRFAKEGASLCITGRNADNLRKVGLKCKEHGSPNVVEVVADLALNDSCQQIISEALEKFERLDVLVNNAGIARIGGIENATMEDYNDMFNVNLKSAFFVSQLATPYLKKVKGSIVNVSSVSSTTFFSHLLVYGMTKSAMDYFTKCTALELAPSGVRVNAVNPGAVKTNIHAHRMTDAELQKYYKDVAAEHPLGRIVSTGDVTDAVIFLASEDASMITGTCLLVDGGMSLTSG